MATSSRREHMPDVRVRSYARVRTDVRRPASVRLPVARANAWLLIANARYWRTVAPVARAELRRWEQRARSIDDPVARRVALEKLSREGFNAEVAATLAVFAPPRRRAQVATAIVALEVLYDYLDGLAALARTEGSWEDEALFASFVDAFGQPAARPRGSAGGGDGGYAGELASAVRRGLALLPRASALLPTMRNAARRTAEGQLRSHAVAREGRGQLEGWARSAATGSDLAWPEFAGGAAASVLAVHALIAAAADERTTALAAREIDRAYLMISAISTMLDSVNDYQRDLETGRPRAVDWYDAADPAQQIASLARRALARTARIPTGRAMRWSRRV